MKLSVIVEPRYSETWHERPARDHAQDARATIKRPLLLGLALLQQQVVSLNDDLVTGVKSVANFNPVAALDPCDYDALLIAVAFGDENHRFPAVVQHRRLRNRNRG